MSASIIGREQRASYAREPASQTPAPPVRAVPGPRAILSEIPLTAEELGELEAKMPQRTGSITDTDRIRRFEHGLASLRRLIVASRGAP